MSDQEDSCNDGRRLKRQTKSGRAKFITHTISVSPTLEGWGPIITARLTLRIASFLSFMSSESNSGNLG